MEFQNIFQEILSISNTFSAWIAWIFVCSALRACLNMSKHACACMCVGWPRDKLFDLPLINLPSNYGLKMEPESGKEAEKKISGRWTTQPW